MNKRNETGDFEQTMIGWRHALHADPEFGFEEHRTAAMVARTLRSFGLDVTEGVGGTGVIGTLSRGISKRRIALRADMDALRIKETTGAEWASRQPGVMHACGHDGHTAILLGAARILASDDAIDGTIHFIFQPAEEWGRGALAMIEDGLVKRFPFDEIYGLHNLPGLPVGHVATRPGPIMSAEDLFEIELRGESGHASQPHMTREVMVPACSLVTSLQTIVSRRVDPTDIAVVSVTELETDGGRNILPGTARISGDARSFRTEVSKTIEAEIRRIAEGVAQLGGLEAKVHYSREFVSLVNDARLVDAVAAAAATVALSVDPAAAPISASEDFARFLDYAPGCFSFIGNGEESAPLHSPNFDFNDAALKHGVALHVATARARLSTPAAA
ncbi:MAG: amidohydrolase [Salinisphaera sp.]|jgi:amidohydrolase|nr:amidohydrolase [Salinisphaera sp.]